MIRVYPIFAVGGRYVLDLSIFGLSVFADRPEPAHARNRADCLLIPSKTLQLNRNRAPKASRRTLRYGYPSYTLLSRGNGITADSRPPTCTDRCSITRKKLVLLHIVVPRSKEATRRQTRFASSTSRSTTYARSTEQSVTNAFDLGLPPTLFDLQHRSRHESHNPTIHSGPELLANRSLIE